MKKKRTKVKVSKEITPDLPQNIVSVGERVFDDKNIYIHQKVYAQIHKFSANKTENEHGGILVGRVLNEMGKENTIIEGFIEAKYNAATPTTLTFTHETWEHFHSEMDKKYKGKKIVGWIHTHPNFGIFLSENDKFIQQNFFTDVNQVAYVVDPIQHDEGFFFWVNDKLERCPGFYLFDKNGVKIKQKAWSADSADDEEESVVSGGKVNPILAIALVLVILVNLFVMMQQSKKIGELEKQVDDMKVIMQYGFMGGSDISYEAENIRQYVAAQQEAQRKAMEEAQKKQQEQEANQTDESEKTTDESAEKAPENTEKPDGEKPAGNETNEGNNGGNE